MPRVKRFETKYDKQTRHNAETFTSALAVSKLTQKDLEKRTHIQQSTISRILRNINNAKLCDLRAIANEIGVEILIRRKPEDDDD